MAPPQVHHHPADKLARIGLEGFGLLEEFFDRPKKSGGKVPATPSYDDQQTQTLYYLLPYKVYRGPHVVTVLREPVVMDSNRAAQFYGGMSVVDHSIRKTIRSGRANY